MHPVSEFIRGALTELFLKIIPDGIEVEPLLFLFALLYIGFILGVLTDRLSIRSERRRQPAKPPIPTPPNSQSGSVFTVLLAAIAMAGALSFVMYQTVSGPMSSMVRVTNKTSAKSQMMSVSSIVIMDALNQASGGDCDADGSVEPRAWRVGAGPTGGGLLPNTIGAPMIDPWSTDYGYCVWDVGTQIKVAGCDGANGPNTQRLSGTPTVMGGSAVTQTVLAIISAGPNRQFQSTCRDYVDATTDLITAGGDDIVQRFTYKEASSTTSSLWTLKPLDPTQAVINKDLAIGPTAAPTVSVNATTGVINALALITQGRIRSGGAIQLATQAAVLDADCLAGNLGDMRFNTALVPKVIQVCDGLGTWNKAGGGLWTDNTGSIGYLDTFGAMRVGQVPVVTAPIAGATSSQWITSGLNIYYNVGNVGIGTASPGAPLHVYGASGADTWLTVGPSAATAGDGFNVGYGGLSYGAGKAFLNAHAAIAANAAMLFDINSVEKMRIDNLGNVGIGTASPNTELDVNKAVAGDDVTVRAHNADNTNGLSNGVLVASVAGASAGDPYAIFSVGGAQAWSAGVDNSDSDSFKFAASGGLGSLDRLTITTGGNVGIGTTSPGNLLALNGAYPQLTLNNPSVGSGSQMRFQDAGTVAGVIGHLNSTGKLQFSGATAAAIHMTIDGPTGNVGIGTTVPVEKLSVGDAIGFIPTPSSPVMGRLWYATDNSGWQMQIGKRLNSTGVFTPQLTVADTGNVGIGTTSPLVGVKLDVSSGGHTYVRSVTTAGVNWDAGSLYSDGTNAVYAGLLNGSACGAGNWAIYSVGCRIVVTSAGNVGIGTTGPADKLTVTGTVGISGKTTIANQLYLTGGWGQAPAPNYAALQIVGSYPSMEFRSSTSNSTWLYHMSANGYMNWYNDPASSNGAAWSNMMQLSPGGALTASAFYYSSDRKLKKNITTLTGSLDGIRQLRGVGFDWKKGGTRNIGLIAQEVEKVYPELVETKADFKSVAYGNLVAPLIEAVKELAAKMDAWWVEVNDLKQQLQAQQKIIEQMQKEITRMKRS